MPKIAVITAITGKKDALREDICSEGAELHAFTDAESKKWIIHEPHSEFEDQVRNAKIHKVLPHKYVDCDYSIWIDGNISMHRPAERLIKEFLGDGDMWAMTHFGRDCVYDEAFTCMAIKFDDIDTMGEQIYRYHKEGYPKHNGLYECNVIIRRHNDRVNKLNEAWWDEICNGSRRDQISFPYVLWKVGGIDMRTTKGNVRSHPYFTYVNHNYVFGSEVEAEELRAGS